METNHQPWWQTTTIYHIYPRSFYDSNQDGIGDIQGIIAKLDELVALGVKTLWCSPFFLSPQVDHGYDVENFCEISPEYGTMADVENLIQSAHAKGLRILFDLVMNHTSDQCPWFIDSQSSENHPKRDWYIWHKGRKNWLGQPRPPNNWLAVTGGSAWQWHKKSQMWYYASFLPFQPDLNYHNPKVRQTMLDVAKFWMDKGVDGFRLDIFFTVYKDAQLRNNPYSWRVHPGESMQYAFFQKRVYNQHQPEAIELAQDLRKLCLSYPDEKMLLGELFGTDEQLRAYMEDSQRPGLNLVFLWHFLKPSFTASFFSKVITHYEREYPAPMSPVYVLGNHDQIRFARKIPKKLKPYQTSILRLMALLQLTVRGVAVIYYGEEIGMVGRDISFANSQDPITKRFPKWFEFVSRWQAFPLVRDVCRTPMQWSQNTNAGFCQINTTPWLPIGDDALEGVDVATQRSHPTSLWSTYQQLLQLRNRHEALHSGTLELISLQKYPNLLMYRRQSPLESFFVLMNWSDSKQRIPVKDCFETSCQWLWCTQSSVSPSDWIELEPYSGGILSATGEHPA